MAFKFPSSSFISLSITLFLFLLFSSSSVDGLGGGGGRLGGRTEINDVKNNKEIQDLGKFSVKEYNKQLKGNVLTFSEVKKAEKQVVAGINYYLKISALQNGVPKMFNAVLFVKPKANASPVLVSFDPSTTN